MSRPFIDFAVLSQGAEDVRKFKAGDVIFNAGDAGEEFYILRKGKVAVQLGNRKLAELNEGEVFGEMALIDAGPRSASVVAETDCEVVPVSEKQFLYMTSEAPYFALSLMRIVVQRLRTANSALA